MEPKRTLVAPERSLGGFGHGGCPKDTSRKLHINFQIFTFLESRPTPGGGGDKQNVTYTRTHTHTDGMQLYIYR